MKEFSITFILFNGDEVEVEFEENNHLENCVNQYESKDPIISIASHFGKAEYKNKPLYDLNRTVIVGTKA